MQSNSIVRKGEKQNQVIILVDNQGLDGNKNTAVAEVRHKEPSIAPVERCFTPRQGTRPDSNAGRAQAIAALPLWLTEKGLSAHEAGHSTLGDHLLQLASDFPDRIVAVGSLKKGENFDDGLVDVIQRAIVLIDDHMGSARLDHDAISAATWVEIATALARFDFIPKEERWRRFRLRWRLRALDPARIKDVSRAWRIARSRTTAPTAMLHQAMAVGFGAFLLGCSAPDPITCSPPETAKFHLEYRFQGGTCHYDPRRGEDFIFKDGFLSDRLYEGCIVKHQEQANGCRTTTTFVCAGGDDTFDFGWTPDWSRGAGTAQISYSSASCSDTYDVLLTQYADTQ